MIGQEEIEQGKSLFLIERVPYGADQSQNLIPIFKLQSAPLPEEIA
jgi:hypothetical protein